MPSPRKSHFRSISLAVCLATLLPSPSRAQESAPQASAEGLSASAVPRLVKFFGAVKDARGEPRTGPAEIRFVIYAQPEGGEPLWEETQRVTLDAQGRYSVLLGATQRDGLAPGLFASGEPRWLGAEVLKDDQGTDAVPAPRVLLVSVPYALKAADAETLGGRPASHFVLSPDAPPLTGNDGAAVAARPLAPGDGAGALNASRPESGVLSGLGTPGFLAKFVGPRKLGNSILFESNGLVGVNNPSPTQPLDVLGNIKISGSGNGLIFPDGSMQTTAILPGAGTGTVTQVNSGPGLTGGPIMTTGTLGLDLAFTDARYLQPNGNGSALTNVNALTLNGMPSSAFLQTGAVNNIFMGGASFVGAVGIGTTTPSAPLEVAGNMRVSGTGSTLTVGGNVAISGTTANGVHDGTLTVTQGGADTAAAVGCATSSPANCLPFEIYLSAGQKALSVQTAGTEVASVDSAGVLTPGGVNLPPLGAANAAQGFTSTFFDVSASAFDPATSASELQRFRWQANPLNSNQASRSGQLSLLFGQGSAPPSPTGLSIAANGIINFAPGQTFSGGAGGGYTTMANNGMSLSQRSVLNFPGGGLALSATDNAGANRTDVTLLTSPGGASAVVGVGRVINPGFGLIGGGDLSHDVDLACFLATLGQDGCLFHNDFIRLHSQAHEIDTGTCLTGGPIGNASNFTLPPPNPLVGTISVSPFCSFFGNVSANNTWTGNNTWNGTSTFAGNVVVTAPLDLNPQGTATPTSPVSSNPLTSTASGFDPSFGALNLNFTQQVDVSNNNSSPLMGADNFYFGVGGATPMPTGAGTDSAGRLIGHAFIDTATGMDRGLPTNCMPTQTVAFNVSWGCANFPSGGGGGGTVTSVATDNTLTVNGVPGGTFTTAGQVGANLKFFDGRYPQTVGNNIFIGNNANAGNFDVTGAMSAFTLSGSAASFNTNDPTSAAATASNSGAGPGVIGTSTNGPGGEFTGGKDGITVIASTGTVIRAIENGTVQNLFTGEKANGTVLWTYDANGHLTLTGGEDITGTENVTGDVNVTGNLNVTGMKHNVVKVDDGRVVALNALETPDSWFEDFGSAQLRQGVAQVTIEAVFLQTVNTEYDYHVFLTPLGDCRGLFVARKTPSGFEVRELGGGRSSIRFDYRIVAKRRGYEKIRLEQVPGN